jgi:WD40 repeat protein
MSRSSRIGYLLGSLLFTGTLSLGQGRPAARVDTFGDPLPNRVLARMGTVRLRHEHTVQALAFAPDGQSLASCGNDYTVRLWELPGGRELRQFGHHPARASADSPARTVHSVALSPDGKKLAAGFGDNAVYVWETATGKQLYHLQGHTGPIRAVAFAPDGKTLASGSGDQSIRLWDPATGKLLRAVAGQEPITTLAFAPNSQFLLAGTAYGSVRVFQVANGAELRVIEGHKGPINTVSWSPDGHTAASAGADKVVRLWDVSQGMNPQFSPFVWSGIPGLGRRPGFISLIQGIEYLRMSQETRELAGHQAEVQSSLFLRDGKTLVTAGQDRTVRFWDVTSRKELRQLEGQLGPITCLALSADGKTFATGDEDCTIRLWDAATGKEQSGPGGHQGYVEYVSYSADGRTLTTSSRDLTIRLWDPATGKELRQFAGRSRKGTSVAHSADGKLAASGAPDGTIHLWDPATGKEIRHFSGHHGAVLSLAFAPDSRTLASGGEDQTVRFWDPATGEALDQLHGSDKGVAFVVFSPDGKTVAAGAGDEIVFLWAVATGKEIHHFGETGADVDSVAFSPDSKILAVGSRDGIVRLWDTATSKLVRQFEGQPGAVFALAFAADGKTVAAGSWLTVRLWETLSGRERGRLDGQQGDVRSLAFAPDGKTLAVGASGTTVTIWDITSRLSEGRLEEQQLTEQQLDAAWNDLHSEDAGRAYRAIWTLVAGAKQSVPFLQSHLKPMLPLGPEEQKRIEQSLTTLASDDFTAREMATTDLEKLGESAEPALRKLLAAGPGPETRERIEQLLEKLHSPARLRERLRALRGSEVLEKIGSPEARQVLKALAEGGAEFTTTLDARGALERLERRTASVP